MKPPGDCAILAIFLQPTYTSNHAHSLLCRTSFPTKTSFERSMFPRWSAHVRDEPVLIVELTVAFSPMRLANSNGSLSMGPSLRGEESSVIVLVGDEDESLLDVDHDRSILSFRRAFALFPSELEVRSVAVWSVDRNVGRHLPRPMAAKQDLYIPIASFPRPKKMNTMIPNARGIQRS